MNKNKMFLFENKRLNILYIIFKWREWKDDGYVENVVCS